MKPSPDASERLIGRAAERNTVILSAMLALAVAGCSGQTANHANIATSTRMSIADIAAAGGDTESARSILAAAAQADPDNGDLQLRYAMAQLQSGRPDDAIGTARQTVARKPDDAVLAVKAAQLELRAGDATLAAATFELALAHGATGTPALNGLGVARMQLGELAAAEDAFRKAIAIAPGDYAARNNLGLALVIQGRADEAVPMLQSLADEPGVPERVRYNLALAYAQKGDTRQASVVLTSVVGSAEASREVAAFAALRTQPPTAVANRLGPALVLEGKTSGPAYAGMIPGPGSGAPQPAAARQQLAEAPVKPAQLHAAPVATVGAVPIAPPAPKVAAATPNPTPSPSGAPVAAAPPTPNVITPTDPPLADPGVAAVAPAGPSPATAAAPETAAAAAPAAAAPATTNIMVFEPADDGTIKVRIAAVPSRSAALTLWQNLVGLEPDLFNGRTPLVREATESGHQAWHLGTGGFQDTAAAEQFCRLVRARGPNCNVGL